jgi:uncharacterized phage-associated protein
MGDFLLCCITKNGGLEMSGLKFEKTVQAVACLLRLEPSSEMSYMRLLKLLYIADRESLGETGAPITGDSVVAMKRGPVLSETYDLIKSEHLRYAEWEAFFRIVGYRIEMVKDPGIGKLCRYEIEKLKEVSERYRSCDEWDMVNETHEFPEWKKNDPGDSVRPIPLRDILRAVGRENDREAIEQDAAASECIGQLLGD